MEKLLPGHQNDNCYSDDETQQIYVLDCMQEDLYDLQPGHERKPLAQR